MRSRPLTIPRSPRPSAFLRLLVSVGLVLAFVAPALADVRTEARRHFRRGMQLVAEGQVDEGIEELHLAYETLPHPNVLYNIGRAYAEAGRYEESIEYFERYLASDPPDREEVQGFLEAIEARIAAQQPQQAPTEGEGTTATTTAPAAAEVDVSSAEIAAIEESATQIEALAEATQSEALRQRANRLRQLAQSLRERGAARAAAAAEAEGDPGDDGDVEDVGEGEIEGQGEIEGTVGIDSSGGQHEGLNPDAASEIGLEDLGEERTEVFEEEVVSASRFAESPLDAPNSTHIITQQDIRLSGLTNISELLRRVAGVTVMRLTPSQIDIGIRGLNQRHANKVLFLVDGRSVRLDFLASPFVGFLPWAVEDIERIEVIRGPAAAVYGADAFSGIVNIILKRPGQGDSYLTARGGNYQTIRGVASTSARTDWLGIRVTGGYERTQNYAAVVGRERVDTRVFDGYRDPDVGLERLFLSGEGRIDFGEGYVARVGGAINANGRGTIHGVSRQRQIGAENVTFAQSHVTMTTPFGLGVRTYWTRFSTDVDLWAQPPGSLDTLGDIERSDVVDTELSFNRQFHLLVDHNFAVGVGHRFKQIEWNWLELPEITEHHFFGYLQDALRLHEKLRLTLSFRVDRHPLLDNLQFSPRGSLVWRFLEGQALRLTAGTAFRSPSFIESYLEFVNPVSVRGATAYGVGNRNLDPERVFSVELGYANQATDFFALEVNAYYNLVFEQIALSAIDTFTLQDFGPNGPVSPNGERPARYLEDEQAYPLGQLQYNNEALTFQQYGGEIGLRAFPVDGLDLYINYAINETEPIGDTSNVTDPGRLLDERTSTHMVNLGVQYRSPIGLDFNVDFHWVSDQVWVEQVTSTATGVDFAVFPLDAYVLLNARIGLRLFDDQLELGIIGTNLTFQENRQHPLGQPITTRVMGEATLRF